MAITSSRLGKVLIEN
uniref:Uncharacterized protein n=1 Tax=Anguilla anguilla TaxID=7936 RepID=A0A0E9TYQ2_ANGAN